MCSAGIHAKRAPRAARSLGVGVALLFAVGGCEVRIIQVPDPGYIPDVPHPAYRPGGGPVVLVDATHRNLGALTAGPASGLYAPLGKLLEADGYQVQGLDVSFETDPEAYREALDAASILVLGQPRADFSDAELEALIAFFGEGGGILLATERPDRTPNLMTRLQLGFTPSRVTQWPRNCPETRPRCPIEWNTFRRSDRSMSLARPESNGRDDFDEAVDSVVSFDGYGLLTDPATWPAYRKVLTYGPSARYVADPNAPPGYEHAKFASADGLPLALALDEPQLAGRLFVVTDFEMLTALTHAWSAVGRERINFDSAKRFHPIGFQVEGAEQNQQFVLNVVHWLDPGFDPPLPPAPAPGTGSGYDPTYLPEFETPLRDPGTGPLILYDDVHTSLLYRILVDGTCEVGSCRYEPFRRLAEADGYRFQTTEDLWDTREFEEQIAEADILMLVGPLRNCEPTALEVQFILDWVRNGGSLFVVIDHPNADGIANLASELGIEVGLSSATVSAKWCHPFVHPRVCVVPQIQFNVDGIYEFDGLIIPSHPVTEGRSVREEINLLRTFNGGQYRLVEPRPDAIYDSLLLLPEGTYGPFGEDFSGWSMGMAIELGEGRVYLHGEAGSLTARTSFGLQDHYSEDNEQYALNVLHWLDGTLWGEQGGRRRERRTLSDEEADLYDRVPVYEAGRIGPTGAPRLCRTR